MPASILYSSIISGILPSFSLSISLFTYPPTIDTFLGHLRKMFRTKNESRETKAGISASTARLKRVAQSNELRRSDREELLSSRRRDDRPEFQSTVPSLSDEEIIKDVCLLLRCSISETWVILTVFVLLLV